MQINCSDHRKFMELLALRTRLEREEDDPEERERIQKRIKELEADLKVL